VTDSRWVWLPLCLAVGLGDTNFIYTDSVKVCLNDQLLFVAIDSRANCAIVMQACIDRNRNQFSVIVENVNVLQAE
jgi:hypothetical protein